MRDSPPIHDTGSYGSLSSELGSDIEPEIKLKRIVEPNISVKSPEKLQVIDSKTGQTVEGHVLRSESPYYADVRGTYSSALGAVSYTHLTLPTNREV